MPRTVGRAPSEGSFQLIAVAYHADLKEVQSDPPLAALLAAAAAVRRSIGWRGGRACPTIAASRRCWQSHATATGARCCRSSSPRRRPRSPTGTPSARPVVSPGADGRPARRVAPDLTDHAYASPSPACPTRTAARPDRERLRAAGWLAVARPATPTTCSRSPAAALRTTSNPPRPAAHHAQTQSRQGGRDGPHPLRCRRLGGYEAIYAQAGSPPKAARRSCAALPRRKARPAGCGSASRAPKAGRRGAALDGRGRHGVHPQARPRRGGQAAFARHHAQRGAVAHVIDEDRVAPVDFGTGDDAYKRDWMEEVAPALPAGHVPARWSAQLAGDGRAQIAPPCRTRQHG